MPDLDALREGIAVSIALAWDYRFFAREMLALLRADPELAATYHEIYERRLDEWHALGERLVAHGLVRPPNSPHTLRDLNEALWLVAEGWLPFLDATGERVDAKHIDRGLDLVFVVLESHLTTKGRRAMKSATAPRGKKKGAHT